ncbi:hypothetical protein G7046_g408 [Stylonectria norvegica]|nr:hypothetical protein G7046_g408 [Stylonectria norvegica]
METSVIKLEVPLGEEVVRLSTLDQQAQRNYVNVLLFFKLSEASDNEKTLFYLKQGLGAAVSEIPDFASTIHPRPDSKRRELELRLGPESGVPLEIRNHVLMARYPSGQINPLHGKTFAALAENNFPMANIPKDALFSPQPSCEELAQIGVPALLATFNLIEGGLIMALSWHHTVSDARGINTFLTSWARHTNSSATRRVTSTVEAPEEETRQRWRLEYGHHNATIAMFSDYVVDPTARSPVSSLSPHLLDLVGPEPTAAPVSTWYFSLESLESLQKAIGEANPKEKGQFTRSEVVAALIWKHVSLGRLLHRATPEATSLFSTRIDFRARVRPPLHDAFIGNVTEPNARVRMSIQEICRASSPASLAAVAEAIRNAAADLDDDAMRLFIGLIETLPAVTDLTWKYDTFPGPDLAVTDMSNMDTLRQNWGGQLGLPICVRSGSRERGVVYFLPQDANGGLEVQLQVEKEVVERLEGDEAFSLYAKFRC